MKTKLPAVIATVATIAFSASFTFAWAPEKDSNRAGAKSVPSQTATAAHSTPSQKPAKGEVAQKQEPTMQAPVAGNVATQILPPQTEPIVQPFSSPAVGEQIKWQVVSGGGTQGVSTNYKLDGTIGQTAAGTASSASYKVNAGYWQNFSSSCCVKEGDCNHNGSVNIVDVTFIVARLFQGGAAPPCQDEADVTDNGSVNVVDLTTLVAFLFNGGSVGVCP